MLEGSGSKLETQRVLFPKTGKEGIPGENDRLKPEKSSHDGQESAGLFRASELRALGDMCLSSFHSRLPLSAFLRPTVEP